MRLRGGEEHLLGGPWALGHYPEENYSFKSLKTQGKVAGELGESRHSGAGIWTACHLTGQHCSILQGSTGWMS